MKQGKPDEYSIMLIASGIMAAVVLAFVLFVIFRFTPTAPREEVAKVTAEAVMIAYEI